MKILNFDSFSFTNNATCLNESRWWSWCSRFGGVIHWTLHLQLTLFVKNNSADVDGRYISAHLCVTKSQTFPIYTLEKHQRNSKAQTPFNRFCQVIQQTISIDEFFAQKRTHSKKLLASSLNSLFLVILPKQQGKSKIIWIYLSQKRAIAGSREVSFFWVNIRMAVDVSHKVAFSTKAQKRQRRDRDPSSLLSIWSIMGLNPKHWLPTLWVFFAAAHKRMKRSKPSHAGMVLFVCFLGGFIDKTCWVLPGPHAISHQLLQDENPQCGMWAKRRLLHKVIKEVFLYNWTGEKVKDQRKLNSLKISSHWKTCLFCCVRFRDSVLQMFLCRTERPAWCLRIE